VATSPEVMGSDLSKNVGQGLLASNADSVDAEYLDGALGMFKSKMEAKIIEDITRKLLPSSYRNLGTVLPEDIINARASWAMITTDSSPAFIAKSKIDKNFKYPICMSKFSLLDVSPVQNLINN
jgi:hypothetical protein